MIIRNEQTFRAALLEYAYLGFCVLHLVIEDEVAGES